MITKITLHNFQCHRNLELDLGRSTVLQGGSNHGKTAVLRAFYWVLFNEAPHDFVSYWAQKKLKKGFAFKDDAYTSVTVEVDGHIIERKRSNDFNGYIVDGTTYEALRADVPEVVTKIFNLADASVQKQFDVPFLLAETPGEASRYLNSLAGLECVDEILSIAKRKVADTSDLVNGAKDAVDSLCKDVKSYGWVKDAEDLYDKARAEQPRIERLSRMRDALARTIADYKAIKDYPEIPEWLTDGDRTEEIGDLEQSLATVKGYVATCKTLARITPALDGINALVEPQKPEYDETDIASLKDSIKSYRSSVADVKKFTAVVASISKLKEPKPSKWEGKLRPLIQSIRNYGEFLETLDSAESTLAKIAKLKEPKPCEWTDRELSTLIRSLRNYHSAVITVSDCRDYLDDAYASLEGVACPVCGRPLSRDTCLL